MKKRSVKKDQMKAFGYYVINYKVQSKEEYNAEQYKKLFQTAFNKKQIAKLSQDNRGIIRQLFESEDKTYLYGVICKFILPDSKALNIESLEIVNYEIEKGVFFNPREAEFIFYPDLHRVCIKKNGKIALNTIIKILEAIFKECIDSEERLELSVQQSEDIFEKITKAKSITSLHIEVSPPNADLNKDNEEFIANELKTMGAGKMIADIKPDAKNALQFGDSSLLNGFLGLARSNGFVRAHIVNDNDKKETIETYTHPELFQFISPSLEEAKKELYNTLTKRFRT